MEKSKLKIILTRGVPASGKSTWAKKVISENDWYRGDQWIRVNNDDIEFVDVRFFPNEASDMIWQLLLRAEKNDNVEDYYSKLIENREQTK